MYRRPKAQAGGGKWGYLASRNQYLLWSHSNEDGCGMDVEMKKLT